MESSSMKKRLNEDVYLEQIYNLVLDADISERERDILLKSKNDLEQGTPFFRVIYELKTALSPLGFRQQISPKVIEFYTEICRQIPTTGSSAIWNTFIR